MNQLFIKRIIIFLLTISIISISTTAFAQNDNTNDNNNWTDDGWGNDDGWTDDNNGSNGNDTNDNNTENDNWEDNNWENDDWGNNDWGGDWNDLDDDENGNANDFDFDIEKEDEDDVKDDISALANREILFVGGDLGISIPINVGEPNLKPKDEYDVDPDVVYDESIFAKTMMLGTPMTASIFLDARVSTYLKGYIKFDLSYTPRYFDQLFTNDWVAASFDTVLNELNLVINAGYKVFFTLGKQNIKWGSCYRWSPTDFVNSERKDPLEPETERKGITGVNIEIPIGTFNIITFFGLEGLRDITDTSVALRLEYAYEIFEIAATVHAKKGSVPLYGLDFAIGEYFLKGTWEFNTEVSFSMGTNKYFIAYDENRPGFDLSDPDLLDAFDTNGDGKIDENDSIDQQSAMAILLDNYKWYLYKPGVDNPFFKIVAGITYTTDNTPEWLADMFIVNMEYFYNGEGYSDAEKNPYAILLGQMQPFQMGQHYLGISLMLTGPFTLDDFSLNANFIMNISDLSTVTLITIGYSGFDYLGMSFYVKFTSGKQGTEFYFSSPITIATFINNIMENGDFLGDQIIEDYEGVLRELFSFGLNLSISF